MVRLPLLHGEREQHVAGTAGPDFKIGNAVLIDFGGKKKLSRIIADKSLIAELHHSEPVVEGFKGGFLLFAGEHMPEHKDRLALTFDTQIF
jgi:hypothetical protein